MITPQDIHKLAGLARISISEADTASFATQIDSVLGYVSQITETTGDMARSVPPLRSVMREDIPTHTSGQYTEALLSNVPSREGQYVRVKKILGTSE